MPVSSLAATLRTRRGVALVLGTVALVSTLQYLPTLGYRFVWDDILLITGNRLLIESGPAATLMRGFWAGSPEPAEGGARAYYRPLTTFSFWLDWHIGGGRPWYFHLVNLLVNALVAALVTLIVWELLHSGIWAAFGGLTFAVHPAHVESVAFVSGRTDLLLALFICGAGYALLRSLRKNNPRWWFAVAGGYALALLCKETALLFPLLVALAPPLTLTRYPRRYWLLVLAVAALAGGYLMARTLVLGADATLPVSRLALHQWINVANTFGLYIRMFLWPFSHRAKLPVDLTLHHLYTYVAYALVFLVSIPVAALRRRFWVALLGYVWTIIFLLPVVNIIPIGPQAAERLLYLPSAGLVMIAMSLLARSLSAHHSLRRAVAVALMLLIAAFTADSALRSRVWRDDRSLFSAMVREAPRAPSAFAGLAGALSPTLPDSAIKLYNRALFFDQGYVPAHINLGILYSRAGDHRRAIHQLRLANELRPGSVTVLNNLGLAYLNAAEVDSALANFERALAADPSALEPRLGRSLALCLLGRAGEAAADLNIVLARRPSLTADVPSLARSLNAAPGQGLANPVHLNRIGSLLVSLADTALADSCYSQSLALDSTYVPALYNAAVLRTARGDTAGARRLAARALRQRPDLPAVRSLHEALLQ